MQAQDIKMDRFSFWTAYSTHTQLDQKTGNWTVFHLNKGCVNVQGKTNSGNRTGGEIGKNTLKSFLIQIKNKQM